MSSKGQLKEGPCPKGHDGVIRDSQGTRRCPECRRQEARRWYRDNRETYLPASRDQRREQARRWRAANVEKARASSRRYMHARRLKENFGLDRQDYQTMLVAQGGVCAICGLPPIEDFALAIDHDHETGVIRGLLCRQCNVGIGNLRDDPALLRAALRYLERGR